MKFIWSSEEKHLLEVLSILARLKNWSEWRGDFRDTAPSSLSFWSSWSRSAHSFYQLPAPCLINHIISVISIFLMPASRNWNISHPCFSLPLNVEKVKRVRCIWSSPSWETSLWSDHYGMGKCVSSPIWPLLTHFMIHRIGYLLHPSLFSAAHLLNLDKGKLCQLLHFLI